MANGIAGKVGLIISIVALLLGVGAAAYCVVDYEANEDYNDVRYTLYIGVDPVDADVVESQVKSYLAIKGQRYTFLEGDGGHMGNIHFVTETSLVFILNDCRERTVEDLVEFLTDDLRLTVMVEKQIVDSELEYDD